MSGFLFYVCSLCLVILRVRGAYEEEKISLCALVTEEILKTNVTTPRDWIEDANRETNLYRKKHNVPELLLDYKLCPVAQYWANELNETGNFKNSEHGCGENIWKDEDSQSGTIEPSRVIQDWYSEIQYYDFEKHGPKGGKGYKWIAHFTQLVWKATNVSCMAYTIREKKDGDKKRYAIYVVASYHPPSEFDKNYDENIFPPNGSGKLIGSMNLVGGLFVLWNLWKLAN